ncbi:MAG: PAS domain S-box protein [Pseudomonadales bacterium]|nr:PAS domain S-box protein [Pseudomonadales bacterium]
MASLFIILVASAASIYLRLQTELVRVEAEVHEMASSHLSSVSERVWVADIDSLRLDLLGILQLQSIEYSAVTDNGRIVAEVGVMPTENVIRYDRPIHYNYQGEKIKIGEFSVVASSRHVYQQVFGLAIVIIVFIALQIFFITGLVSWLFNRNVTRHLRAISEFAGRIELSNIDQTMSLDRSKRHRPDELDILLNALTSMQHQLNQSIVTLRESEENLSLTLDCIGDAVIATDFEGSVARMNPIAEQLTGWLAQDAIGQNIRDVFPIVDAATGQEVENPVEQALLSGEVVTLSNSTTLIAKSGERYQIADSAAPIRDANDQVIGGILVFHDVTDQYVMRRSLEEAELRMKLHIEKTPLGVIEWDSDFRVTEWNPAAEKIFGYSRDAALGHRYQDLLVLSTESVGVAGRWKTFIGDSVAEKFRRKNITQQGKPVHCDWYSTPLLSKDGEMIGVASFVLDVTKRVETEQALAQHRSEQQMLLSYMLDAIIATDADGLIESFNTSAENMFGYNEEEIIGKELRVVFPKEIWSEYDALISQPERRQGRGTLARVYEVMGLKKDGSQFPIRFSIGVPPKQGDSKQNFIFSIHDLTVEKQKEEQLRHSQKMDALGKLTGGIAHDYNNMLGIILGYAELLAMTLPNDPIFKEYLDGIQQAGERGVVLTKKMLSLSGKQVIEASAVNINEVLSNQLQVLRKMLTVRVSINVDLAEEIWSVWIDKGDFSDVIVNLSINAMHAIKTAGTLTLETSNQVFAGNQEAPKNLKAGSYVVLKVTDSGAGMDKATKERIFDPFFTTKGDKGSGLGLSQVYGFVDRSGGAIVVDSELNGGSCFTLYFPKYIQESIAIGTDSKQLDLTHFAGKETILAVDDELDLLNMVSKLLTMYGYKVYTASSARIALEILRNQSVDLVLSDVVMPEMDGYVLAGKIRAQYPTLPIQLVSGFNDSDDLASIDSQLRQNLMTKPYSGYDLMKRIRKILDAQ